MVRRLIAIAIIYTLATVAWLILGATIFERTSSSDSQLRGRVGSTWGTRQAQQAPSAFTERLEQRRAADAPPVRPQRRTSPTTDVLAQPMATDRNEIVTVRTPIILRSSRAAADFELEHRRKGLMWYATYAVGFSGEYRYHNQTDRDSVVIEFPLPASQAIYDDLSVSLDGAPAPYETSGQSLVIRTRVPPGDSTTLSVAYRSQGLDEWRYMLGPDVAEVRDFQLTMRTDFRAIDFPPSTLSPTQKRETDDGWELTWRYSNLISGFQIGMAMPQKLQPGPLAGKIAFFAPVSLLFFFAVVFMIVTIRGINLHPMNYAFLAAGFFAFHLLLAYLVDHISIHLAFVIASAVSVALVVSYLRLAVGPRFAFREAAAAQIIYLVLFSYAFFFTGFTGLAITIGSVLTLFAAMQLTGRTDWNQLFSASRAAATGDRQRPG
jgi:hypothetical protein